MGGMSLKAGRQAVPKLSPALRAFSGQPRLPGQVRRASRRMEPRRGPDTTELRHSVCTGSPQWSREQVTNKEPGTAGHSGGRLCFPP